MRYQPLAPEIFTLHRDQLMAQLPAAGLAVLNSNDVMPTNADGVMGYRQNSDLFYLTGVDQEESKLVLFPGSSDPERRTVLFLRETSALLETWEGARLSKEAARQLSGVTQVHWLDEFPRIFRDMMYEADTVYLNLNEHLRASSSVETRERRFVDEVRRDFPLHQLARLAPLLHRQRMVKSAGELDAIRTATAATRAGFLRLLGFVRPGVHEYEVEAELAHEYLRSRSRGFAYPPIIAAGANACVLHYVENDAPCEDGDLLLLDVAAEYGNYHSDMTRTVPVNGRFTERQRAVYNAVLRVLRAANDLLRPGVLLKEYEKQVKLIMEAELIGLGLLDAQAVAAQDPESPLFKKYFMHGVSHHIGLDVHDVHDSREPLAPNMIVTIEPGIYIREEKLAVRLENLVVIGENGNEDLMHNVPIEADDIEALMGQGHGAHPKNP